MKSTLRGGLSLALMLGPLTAAPLPMAAQVLQAWEFGAKTGIAYNRMTHGVEFQWNRSTTTHAAFVRAALGDRLFVQPELLMSRRIGVSSVAGSTLTLVSDYLEAPLLAQVRLASVGSIGLFATAGPLVTFRYRCRLQFEGGGVSTDDECDSARGVTSNRFDVGATGGGGVRVGLGLLALYAKVRATTGLNSNVLPIDAANARAIGWSAVVGAGIPLARLGRAPGSGRAAGRRPPVILPLPLVYVEAIPAPGAAGTVVEMPLAVRISVDADDVDLADVLDGIARATNTTISMTAGLNRRVTLSVKNVTAEEAVQALVTRTGLAMVRTVQDGRPLLEVRSWAGGPR